MEYASSDHMPVPFTRRGKYILVSEASTIDLFMTAMLLQRFSYRVCTAQNARHALDLVSVALPSLVITDDLDRAGMSGPDLLRVLDSNLHTRSIPAILLRTPGRTFDSALDPSNTRHRLLQKPLDIEDFYRTVQAIMERTPRKHLRVPAELPVILNDVPLDGERGECATYISCQGMFIRTFKYHRPDEDLSLQLTIGGRLVHADAKVLYTRRQDGGLFAEPGLAVKFTHIAAEDRETIRRFVRMEITKGIEASVA